MQPPEPELDALRARLADDDLSEMDVTPAEREGLRELVRRGEAHAYRHRPNDGSSVLTFWELAHLPNT